MSSTSTARRSWALWAGGAALVAAIVAAFVALVVLPEDPPAGVSTPIPYAPLFELTAISDSAPGANADITFRTSLPAGHHIIGLYGPEVPDNSWTVAGHTIQLNGKVTAIGTLTVNIDPDGNCNDGDSGSPQTFGPFPLVDLDSGGGSGHPAIWGGRITDFDDGNPGTNWDLTLTVDQLDTAYTIDGFLTDAILPAGNTICTPEVFTLTTCGHANPTPTATVCGSGADPVVMTSPGSAACYLWTLVTIADSGELSANPQAGVPIGDASCPTPR